MRFLRTPLVKLGYAAIASGARLPRSKLLADFDQWSHLVDLLARLRSNVFLDVGANCGFFSKHLRASGYRGHLFSFEPISDDFQKIVALAKGDAMWHAYEYALGRTDEMKDFFIRRTAEQNVLSSFLPMKADDNLKERITVRLRRLDKVLPELLADIPDPRIFLKMDTQGFDLEVFAGVGKYREKIVGLQSEISVVPLYDGMPHYTEALAHYEAHGFVLMDFFVVNRAGDGRIIEYDCVMVSTNSL